MRTLLAALAASSIALFLPIAAAASCGDTFTVYNSGNHTIEQINVSPHGNSNWGPDLLGSYILDPGYNVRPLQLAYGTNCSCTELQDVRAVYENGQVVTDMAVDICDNNVNFNY